jgi:hypothetical protein
LDSPGFGWPVGARLADEYWMDSRAPVGGVLPFCEKIFRGAHRGPEF